MLTNLVVNASDAMPDGGTITIETANLSVHAELEEQELDRGDWVRLSVVDTGHGIPPEIRARVFEPFFTTKARGEGTGLGLATCYGIVDRCGGTVTLETEVGRGTTFHVHLPRADAPAAQPAADGEGAETILLVEDQAALRNSARSVLVREGYQVHAVRDGTEALRLSATMSPPPVLAIVHLQLPDMDGREVVRQLLERFPGLRILATSGSFVPAEGDQRVTMLPKPFGVEALALAVRSLLDDGER
ncbi:MAG: ATP-binding protein [Gemmatimonadales bacterium]